MKALKLTISVVLMLVSFLVFIVAITSNFFIDDVLISTYIAYNEGASLGVGEHILGIMADGYLTIIEKNYLMVAVIISAVVFYASAYLLTATLRNFPLRSLFTKKYWYQFDFGFSYQYFVPNHKRLNKKNPG